jgi:hypothetical protein
MTRDEEPTENTGIGEERESPVRPSRESEHSRKARADSEARAREALPSQCPPGWNLNDRISAAMRKIAAKDELRRLLVLRPRCVSVMNTRSRVHGIAKEREAPSMWWTCVVRHVPNDAIRRVRMPPAEFYAHRTGRLGAINEKMTAG